VLRIGAVIQLIGIDVFVSFQLSRNPIASLPNQIGNLRRLQELKVNFFYIADLPTTIIVRV
jgi:Leucine-rich repeat (LRR) protein